jgi:hypothetical protein
MVTPDKFFVQSLCNHRLNARLMGGVGDTRTRSEKTWLEAEDGDAIHVQLWRGRWFWGEMRQASHF